MDTNKLKFWYSEQSGSVSAAEPSHEVGEPALVRPTYPLAIIGTAASAAAIPAVFQGVKRSFRIARASKIVITGYRDASTTVVASLPVCAARTNMNVPLTSRHPARSPMAAPAG